MMAYLLMTLKVRYQLILCGWYHRPCGREHIHWVGNNILPGDAVIVLNSITNEFYIMRKFVKNGI
jgi:hypothetical protein